MQKAERVAQLLQRARDGHQPMGICVLHDHPTMVEAVGQFGLEWILVNQEHTTLSGALRLTELIRACEVVGAVSIVKLNVWDPILARDAIDAGAYGVQIPFVNSAEMMSQIVDASRFPPLGSRGLCPGARATWHGTPYYSGATHQVREFIEFVNEHALIIPLIETAEAIEHLDEILALPECPPVISLGPLDLMMSLEIDVAETSNDELVYLARVLTAVTKKIHDAGKLVLSPIYDPVEIRSADEAARNMLQQPIDLPYTSDHQCLNAGLSKMVAICKAMAREREAAKQGSAPDPAAAGEAVADAAQAAAK